MRITLGVAFSFVVFPGIAVAQKVPPVAEQLVSATLPLPKDLRDGAGVLGYKTPDKLETLRAAKNGVIWLANEPDAKQFHVAVYAEWMEPVLARGRGPRPAGPRNGR